MTRVLIDTNVVLDVFLDRQPHVAASAAVWSAIEKRQSQGLLAAHAITTIHFLARKDLGAISARRAIARLLRVFDVAPVDGPVLQDALDLSLPDFEDAVTCAAADRAGCHFIVTRDPRGFRGASASVMTPEAAIPLLQQR